MSVGVCFYFKFIWTSLNCVLFEIKLDLGKALLFAAKRHKMNSKLEKQYVYDKQKTPWKVLCTIFIHLMLCIKELLFLVEGHWVISTIFIIVTVVCNPS